MKNIIEKLSIQPTPSCVVGCPVVPIADRPYFRPGERILSHVSGTEPIAKVPTYDGSDLAAVDALADPRMDVFDISELVARGRSELTGSLADAYHPSTGKDIDSLAGKTAEDFGGSAEKEGGA